MSSLHLSKSSFGRKRCFDVQLGIVWFTHGWAFWEKQEGSSIVTSFTSWWEFWVYCINTPCSSLRIYA